MQNSLLKTITTKKRPPCKFWLLTVGYILQTCTYYKYFFTLIYIKQIIRRRSPKAIYGNINYSICTQVRRTPRGSLQLNDNVLFYMSWTFDWVVVDCKEMYLEEFIILSAPMHGQIQLSILVLYLCISKLGILKNYRREQINYWSKTKRFWIQAQLKFCIK